MTSFALTSSIIVGMPCLFHFVCATLLHGAEAWTTCSWHLRALQRHHQRCSRSILGIHWEDGRTNVSVLKDASRNSFTTILMQHQLRWTGRIVCMPNTRLPKQILCSQLNDGRRGPRWAEETFSGQHQDQPVEVLSQWTTGSLSLWKGACGMKSRTKAQLLMSLNYVMSQTQSDNSKKKDGQRLQPHHTLMWPPQPSQDPPGAPSEDRHTRFRVTADDFVSARLQLHKSRT